MELKGFITGSLVTLGVVGLVAVLKEAVHVEIASLKASLDKLIKSLVKSDAA